MKQYRVDALGCLVGGTAGIIIWAGLVSLFAWVTQICWNAVMPHVFNLPEISFWQAAAIWFLLGIIRGASGIVRDSSAK